MTVTADTITEFQRLLAHDRDPDPRCVPVSAETWTRMASRLRQAGLIDHANHAALNARHAIPVADARTFKRINARAKETP